MLSLGWPGLRHNKSEIFSCQIQLMVGRGRGWLDGAELVGVTTSGHTHLHRQAYSLCTTFSRLHKAT